MPIDYGDPRLKANIEGKYIAFDTLGQEVRGQIITSELKSWPGGVVNPEYNLRLSDNQGERILAASTRDLKTQCFDLRITDGDWLLVRFERQDPPKGNVEGAKYFFVQAFRNGVQLQPEQKQAAWAGPPQTPAQPVWNGQPQQPAGPPPYQGGYQQPATPPQAPAQPAWGGQQAPAAQQPQQPAQTPWGGQPQQAAPAMTAQESFVQSFPGVAPQQPVQQTQVPGMPPAQPPATTGNGQLSQPELDALAAAGLTAPTPY